MMDIYTPIGILFPRSISITVRRMLRQSNLRVSSDKFLGSTLFFGLTIGFIVGSIMGSYTKIPASVGFILSFGAVEFMLYLWVVLSSDSKARFVEEALPDALSLMASNIRAGLTTDKAFLMAARPEFGPLADEIKRIGKETMAGRSLTESLLKTNQNIKSKNLDRTIELIVQSIRSGGKLADLLDQTANDIRDQQMIQKEISASVLMYVFFIFIAVAVGAPLLLSMSSFLVSLLTKNLALISAEMPSNIGMAGGRMPISMMEVKIGPDFIQMYALISLISSSFFGSIAVGLILSGEEKKGIKFFPVMAIIAVALFYLGNYVLDTTLGQMMTF